jgi:LAO/AO transport system kinase
VGNKKHISEKFQLQKKSQHSVAEYVSGIRAGNRSILSEALTLLESTNPEHEPLAQEILTACVPFSGNSFRVGITGVPGVGKSTFIEKFGLQAIDRGYKPAVLAIDPSSSRSHGSILGDKTRMELLSRSEVAFIRPTPTSGSLGGVARRTRECIYLCEAAGFDLILVETVGVGQSETQVSEMVDFFLLLMLAGAGDELQGVKRGIMELAQMVFINKADGDNAAKAKAARAEYARALHMFPANEDGWTVRTGHGSALNCEGMDEVWEALLSYKNQVTVNGFLSSNRRKQASKWLSESVEELLYRRLKARPDHLDEWKKLETAVANGELSALKAAALLIQKI